MESGVLAGTATEQEQTIIRKLNTILSLGQILVESSANTNCIMAEMKRCAKVLGLPEEYLHIDVSYTMLSVNLSDRGHTFSKFQRCEKHSVNMDAIRNVSLLLTKAEQRHYTLDRLERGLAYVRHKKKNYPPLVVAVGAGMACGGFCKLFGCDWAAFLLASASAFVGFYTRLLLNQLQLNHYLVVFIASLVATCCAYLTYLTGWSSTPMHPLLACALFIIPGVPMINFVDDMVDNFIAVGIVRALNTCITVGMMSFGIVVALRLMSFTGAEIGREFSELSTTPHDPYWNYAVAAAISAMGFSMIFNVRKGLLWIVALGGMLSVCTRNFVNFELGYGPLIGSFSGAIVAGCGAIALSRQLRIPHNLLAIPSVIPMVPGVLMYRSLIGLFNMQGIVGEVTTVVYTGLNASLIVLAIAFGVSMPAIVLRDGRRIASTH